MQWPRLRIGTRSSRLALVQVEIVKAALCRQVPDIQNRVDVVVFDTPGDQNRAAPLEELGGRGVFTDNLDEAVTSGHVDFVVHAMKDMAPTLPCELALGATLGREDPREVLVSPRYSNLSEIPSGGVFGSSSIRRRALLRRLRPDLKFNLLRGNVEQRIAQLADRNLDGTILAYAGLARLNLTQHIQQFFSLEELPPDPGQGAIGIICHSDNFVTRRLLQQINHEPTFFEVSAERALLRSLPKPDALAIGAIARVNGSCLLLRALLVCENGTEEWSGEVQGHVEDSDLLGERLAAILREPALRLVSA